MRACVSRAVNKEYQTFKSPWKNAFYRLTTHVCKWFLISLPINWWITQMEEGVVSKVVCYSNWSDFSAKPYYIQACLKYITSDSVLIPACIQINFNLKKKVHQFFMNISETIVILQKIKKRVEFNNSARFWSPKLTWVHGSSVLKRKEGNV